MWSIHLLHILANYIILRIHSNEIKFACLVHTKKNNFDKFVGIYDILKWAKFRRDRIWATIKVESNEDDSQGRTRITCYSENL